ncbi:MAG: hypothetical protein ACLQU3_32530 [Limisphaerales bacterium]
MNENVATVMQRVNALVDEYRACCLWFLREDYYPQTPAQACRVLESIERHGDRVAFQKAATLRQWLLQNSSVPSAA